MKSQCSIIIPTYNRRKYLEFCLESIKKYTDVPNDLIIINNGSTDGTGDFLKHLKLKNAIVINNKKNLGVAAALIQAERLAKTKYLLTMDDDAVASPHWLRDLITIYNGYPKVKLLGPVKPSGRMDHPYLKMDSRAARDFIRDKNKKAPPKELLRKYCVGRSYSQFIRDFKKNNHGIDTLLEVPPEILGGCCALTERSFIKKIGGYTDKIFTMYGSEDADRSWRVANEGFGVMRTGRVYVHHFEVAYSGIKINKQINIKNNNRRFLKKWSSEFWGIIAQKMKKGLSFDEIAQNYWFLREILKNLDVKSVPANLQGDYLAYIRRLV
ncbi:MAG: glycosyltransferase family 2 protein [Patescibacteria group bacterium]|nr:glycosyltransferase family 2 protein [Patescibacteria group bacterium]